MPDPDGPGTPPATVAQLLAARSLDDRPALIGPDRTWSWREYVAEAGARAEALRALHDPARPFHVGLLLDNVPETALQLAAAGLGGHVVVGLNTTRRGSALLADIRKADVQILLTNEVCRALLDPIRDRLDDVRIIETPEVFRSLQRRDPSDVPTASRPVPGPDDLFMLIFTSGTSGEPKAVRVTHFKVAHPGAYLRDRLGLTSGDVHYISMPLFHSNGVLAGWAPALTTGAAFAVADFSASGFLDAVRRVGATYANYVGKPLAYVLSTPEHPDDADNPLRLVFGNEAGDRDAAAFGRRFGCRVVDGFGSTENAVIVSRTPDTPPGSLGRPFPDVAVLDPETGRECPRANHDEHGQVTNLEECVGELVNIEGAGQFAGYYNDDQATSERMRDGMYWSGDLAYRDADGWVYYAGRTADWLRVDGENLAAAPIERLLLRHPAIAEAAVYAVPDPLVGDQLAVALVLRASLGPEEFEHFLSEQDDLGAKQWPSVVRIADELPRTATNKVLKRVLREEAAAFTWSRAARGTTYSG